MLGDIISGASDEAILCLEFMLSGPLCFEAVTRDEDGEVQEGEGGIGDGPGAFEVGLTGVSKVNELFKLLVGARGGVNTVINVAEEEGLFHISYEEAWPMATPLICWKWEELKEKLFR
eukprot:g25997.t1